MSHCSRLVRIASLVMLVALCAAAVHAMPPSPEAIKQWQEEGILDQKLAILKKLDEPNRMTSDQIAEAIERNLAASSAALSADADEVDTVHVCVLLVDFQDFHWDDTYYAPGSLTATGQIQPYQFDSLMFSRQGIDALYNPTGSMTEFYLETSYGKYFIIGDVKGWFTVDNDYSYYVADDNGGHMGPTLVYDAVMKATPDVDFSNYAYNGTVPGLIVVHAGPGAEQGSYGIWSHRSSTTVVTDGVAIGAYTLNPEEDRSGHISNVGVFCHEWGHVLGLPDWYDVDYNPGSEGLGGWDVMASGSWNDGGRMPSHFSAWSKAIINAPHYFSSPTVLTANLANAPIPMAELNPVLYIMKDQFDIDHPGSAEWFMVENRQRYGFDESLPGSGLLIYHFDPLQGDNTDPYRYRLGLVQADGLNQLNFGGSDGDSGDPFPGSTDNREFHDYSVPSAMSYEGTTTQVGVWDITDSDSLMFADLDVVYSRPWLIPGDDSLMMYDEGPYGEGDGDGIFEQGELVAVKVEFLNKMKISYLPWVKMTCSNPLIQMVADSQSMGTALNPIGGPSENLSMLLFRIPDDFRSSRVTFTFTVSSYNDYADPTRTYETVKSYRVTLGRPQILLVDDDNGRNDQAGLADAIDRLGIPFDIWDKDLNYSPSSDDLSRYENVFWTTGRYYPPSYMTGELDATDVSVLEQYLNGGGNLMLTSFTAASYLSVSDPTFMADYLHASLSGTYGGWRMRGEEGTTIGNGERYMTTNGSWTEMADLIEPANGGVNQFIFTGSSSTTARGHCGVSYDGDYRTFFLTLDAAFLQTGLEETGVMPPDTLITRVLDFFYRGTATAVDDDPSGLLPNGFALDQNYPNPFNPTTTISYSLGAGQTMTNLAVFNVLGQKVATLVNEVQGPGNYTVTWNGASASGGRVASGIYFYRLTRGEDIQTRKMVLLK